MSTYYFVFAEVNVDGKWYNLSPYYKNKAGEFKTHPIFWMQSDFYEVYEDLRGFSQGCGIPDDMSESLRAHFHQNLDEQYDNLFGKMSWRDYYSQTVFRVNFANALVDAAKKKKEFKYEGYVSKKDKADYENDDINEIYDWLTKEEYDELSPEEKRRWIWFRWNDPYGKNEIYSELVSKIRTLCSLFQDANDSDLPALYDGISDYQVRVFIERS